MKTENLSSEPVTAKGVNTVLVTAFSSELISKARAYATLKHFETNHKYDGQPYDVHLMMVYEFACKYIHLLPDNKTVNDILAAAWYMM